MKVTSILKQQLWKRYGTPENPAEWDGLVLGGGKMSQRFWEYLKTIDYLDLESNSVVLDIGGGSTKTGFYFFGEVLREHIKKVIVMDPNIEANTNPGDNVEFIREIANYENLKAVFEEKEITHLSCVSVFEHIEARLRNQIMQAINGYFQGDIVVITLEYHPQKRFFEHQLTAKTLGEMVSYLTNFYLEQYSSSPVHCENAISIKPFFPIPMWYPVAARFIRMQSESKS